MSSFKDLKYHINTESIQISEIKINYVLGRNSGQDDRKAQNASFESEALTTGHQFILDDAKK